MYSPHGAEIGKSCFGGSLQTGRCATCWIRTSPRQHDHASSGSQCRCGLPPGLRIRGDLAGGGRRRALRNRAPRATGRQGPMAARRTRGARSELREDPPLESDRHGHHSAATAFAVSREHWRSPPGYTRNTAPIRRVCHRARRSWFTAPGCVVQEIAYGDGGDRDRPGSRAPAARAAFFPTSCDVAAVPRELGNTGPRYSNTLSIACLLMASSGPPPGTFEKPCATPG